MPRRPIVVRLERAIPPDVLFHWTARDRTLTPRRGGAATFARTSTGVCWAADGAPVLVASGRPRWQQAADGAAELLLEPTSTNLVRTDLGNWTRVGGLGALTSATWGHDAMWTLPSGTPGSQRIDATTGSITSATPRVSVVTRWTAAVTVEAGLCDTTANAERGRVSIAWAAAASTAPTVTNVSGATGIRVQTLNAAQGIYRVSWSASACVNGNGHRLSLYPSSTSATRWALPQVEQVGVETTPIAGTAAGTVRAAESLSWASLWTPEAATMLVDLTDYGLLAGGTGGTSRWLSVGNATAPLWHWQEGAAGETTTVYDIGSGNYTYSSVSGVAWGDRVELAAQLPATGAVVAQRAIGRGAVTQGASVTTGTVTALATTWGADALVVTPLRPLGLRQVRVSQGVETLAALQGPT